MAEPQQSLAAQFREGPRSRILREYRQAGQGSVVMFDISQAAGEISASAFPELIISPSLGAPFPFCCDLGAGRFCGKSLPMDFVVIPPGGEVTASMGAPHALRFLAIAPSTVRACLELEPGARIDLGALHAHLNRDPLVFHGLEALWQELGLGDDTSQLFIDSMIATLLLRLRRLASAHGLPSPRRGGMTRRASGRVIEYMHTHLAESVTLRQLAAVAGLSPYHFARAFRQTHGMPPHRYLTQMRLEHARDLLSRTQLPVTEIAVACGFTPQHLVRRFRRYAGATPGAYRRAVRQDH